MCQSSMESKLEMLTEPSLFEMIAEGNAKALLGAIKGIAMGHEHGSLPPTWTIADQLHKLVECQQGRISLQEHGTRFEAKMQAVDAVTGGIAFLNMAKKSQEKKKEHMEKVYTMMFLMSLDDKYHSAIKELHNDYGKGQDHYPQTIDAAIVMLKDRMERGKASHRTHSSHFNVDEDYDYPGGDPEVLRLHEMALCGDDVDPHDEVVYDSDESEG